MHMLNKRDETHSDVGSVEAGWSLMLPADETAPTPAPDETGDETSPVDPPASGEDNPALSIAQPERRDRGETSPSGDCPECGGGMVAAPIGAELDGELQGEPIAVITEPGDSWCESCRVLLTTDGDVIR